MTGRMIGNQWYKGILNHNCGLIIERNYKKMTVAQLEKFLTKRVCNLKEAERIQRWLQEYLIKLDVSIKEAKLPIDGEQKQSEAEQCQQTETS